MYSDFTCPYCYLEFVRLVRAMERLPEDQRMPVAHGPFQLDDSLSSEGVDKYKFLSSLIPPSALDPMIEDLCGQFKTLGMEMNPRGMLGNSAPAHRLMIWAEEHCPQDQAINLKDELFQIHCCIGKSMSDVGAIVEAAAKAGLTDEAKIRSVLKDSKYATKLKRLQRHAKEDLNIKSVPCLMVFEKSGDRRKLDEATGIETIEGFTRLLQQCA
jgi:predicted DsbA family dithiol-disulfide isomerase